MKVQNPIVGKAAGRNGNLVFQTYHGNTYAHTLPIIYHYPDTPAQQETQAKYYNIMWQFLSIYRSFSRLIPKDVRTNKNVYDVYSKGVFRAAQTFPKAQQKFPPKWFGADTQQQVKVSGTNVRLDVTQEVVKLGCFIHYSVWRRRFQPKFCHVLLINYSMQALMMVSEPYSGSELYAEFSNISKWQSTDIIRVYVALSNREFISNFYRLLP